MPYPFGVVDSLETRQRLEVLGSQLSPVWHLEDTDAVEVRRVLVPTLAVGLGSGLLWCYSSGSSA